MDLFPVDWLARDVDGQYVITVFGKTVDGRSVAVHIEFFPFFYIEVPTSYGVGQLNSLVYDLTSKHDAVRKFCRTVERTSLWGFTDDTKLRLMQAAFPTLATMRRAARTLKARGTKTYESSMDPLLRFFHIRDIAPAAWITIAESRNQGVRKTRMTIEARTTFDKVQPSSRVDRPPLVLASFDLETYSASRRFPQAEQEDDCIIQIATTFKKYGEPEPYRRLIMAYKDTAALPDVEVRCFEDEADMINAWCDELGRESVDIMLGYNTAQFDWKYVYGRSLVLVDDDTAEPRVDLGKLGRILEGGGQLNERELNSAARGQNRFCTLTVPGLLDVDLLQIMRREHRLDSYSLNNVSKHFLGDAKLDLPAHEIFDRFDGSREDRAVIARYAAKDTELPLRLLDKLCILENTFEMANATFCPVAYVLNRGQQIKVYSVLLRKARAMGYVCPDGVGIGVDGKFSGATVLNADRGAYFDIVAGLDFASCE
jgi:DNA polymerase delta subunit 1